MFDPPPYLGLAAPLFPLVENRRVTMLMARDGHETALRMRLSRELGVSLPETGRSTGDDSLWIVWSGARQWLLVGNIGSWSPAPYAYLSEQSDGRAIIAIPTEKARHIFAHGSALDLEDSAFSRGQAALTKLNHFPVLIWRSNDGEDRIFMVVIRSYLESLDAWVREIVGG